MKAEVLTVATDGQWTTMGNQSLNRTNSKVTKKIICARQVVG